MTVLDRESRGEQAPVGDFDHEWGGLEGQALLNHIDVNGGIDIPLWTVDEGCFVWNSLQRQLGGDFKEINVTVVSRETSEGQHSMVARIVLRSAASLDY